MVFVVQGYIEAARSVPLDVPEVGFPQVEERTPSEGEILLGMLSLVGADIDDRSRQILLGEERNVGISDYKGIRDDALTRLAVLTSVASGQELQNMRDLYPGYFLDK